MKLTKAIVARNEAYHKAPAAEKRVMLAKEVLRLMRIGTARPTYGHYCVKDWQPEIPDGANAQPYIARGGIRCDVCAKGALFLAGISFRNQLTVEDLNSNSMGSIVASNRDSGMIDPLGIVRVFGEKILDQIESDFESERHKGYIQMSEDQLAIIMKAIIKNKGKYKRLDTEGPDDGGDTD